MDTTQTNGPVLVVADSLCIPDLRFWHVRPHSYQPFGDTSRSIFRWKAIKYGGFML